MSGNAGTFDGTVVEEEIDIDASSLVLDVGGDAILHHQGTNALSMIEQVTIQGDAFTTSGTGGDLRVHASQGGIALNTDVTSGGEAALVTGNNLVLAQGPLPGDIVLNGTLQAADSLVVISGANILYQSGSLIAPQIGLGASGTIGSPTAPVVLQTDQLSTAPFEANVTDLNGFTVVPSVSAVGVTVNQAVPLPEPVDPEPTPEPVPSPPPVVPPVLPAEVFVPPSDVELDSVFAANDTDFVEEALEVIEDILLEDLENLDPTRPPVWPEDDDFLQRKFRR